jgi:hypothetical protein
VDSAGRGPLGKHGPDCTIAQGEIRQNPQIKTIVYKAVPLVSITALAGGSKDRASGGCRRLVPGRSGDHPPIRIPPQKTRMALYRILPFISFPTPQGSCLVDRRAMPPLTTKPVFGQ